MWFWLVIGFFCFSRECDCGGFGVRVVDLRIGCFEELVLVRVFLGSLRDRIYVEFMGKIDIFFWGKIYSF